MGRDSVICHLSRRMTDDEGAGWLVRCMAGPPAACRAWVRDEYDCDGLLTVVCLMDRRDFRRDAWKGKTEFRLGRYAA